MYDTSGYSTRHEQSASSRTALCAHLKRTSSVRSTAEDTQPRLLNVVTARARAVMCAAVVAAAMAPKQNYDSSQTGYWNHQFRPQYTKMAWKAQAGKQSTLPPHAHHRGQRVSLHHTHTACAHLRRRIICASSLSGCCGRTRMTSCKCRNFFWPIRQGTATTRPSLLSLVGHVF
jgi:hypothetical protein